MSREDGKKWFMIDLARKRSFHRNEMEVLLEVLSRCGYNGIGLYLEGFFQFPLFEGAPRRGCMSVEDASWMVQKAESYHMTVMPMTNLVGHGESFLEQERFFELGNGKNQFNMGAKDFRRFAKSVIEQFVEAFHPSIIHIGGDEVALNDSDRLVYAEFLSDMCAYLKRQGIQTGIWGDMLLAHADIAKQMRKDVVVFDWWYYGHRYESTRMLLDYGFEDIVVCPATQSWDGIVGTQQMCPWKELEPWKCEQDVAADEVEAFLQDAESVGVYDAMLCDWENYGGHLLWNSMHQVARFGRFVNQKTIVDDALSQALFGQDTPYMECMHELMRAQKLYYEETKKMPGKLAKHQHSVDGLFDKRILCKVLQCGGCMSHSLGDEFIKAADKVTSLLFGWAIKTPVEELCRDSLKFAVCYARATAVILNIAKEAPMFYHKAAEAQYVRDEEFLTYLRKIRTCFATFISESGNWRRELENAIKNTGHTGQDVTDMLQVIRAMEDLQNVLLEYENSEFLSETPAFPAWKTFLCRSLGEVDVNE